MFTLRSTERTSSTERGKIWETAGFSSVQSGRWPEETHLPIHKNQGHVWEAVSDPRLSGNNQNIYISSVLSLEHIHAKVYTCRVNASLIIIKRSPDICNKLLKWNIATMICLHCLGHCRLQWFWLWLFVLASLTVGGELFFFAFADEKRFFFFSLCS